MANELYINFQTRLKVTSDSAGNEVLCNLDDNLTRATISDRLISSGTIDLAASESGTTVPLGDITTVHMIKVKADVDGFTLNIDGTEAVPLRQAITGQPAIAQFMTTATSLTVTAGSNAGRLTYHLVGA